jgi:glutathionylspermidine synthase
MRRECVSPRADWRAKVEEVGFDYHTIDGTPYWREDVCYHFTAEEVDTLDDVTAELHSLCLEAVDRIVRQGRTQDLGFDEIAAETIEESWKSGEPALYGRMDLCWDGKGPPKLLEYNADTPTALFEASVVQWHWVEDVKPNSDQFNSIHEKLLARWPEVARKEPLHFAAFLDQAEDRGTSEYLRDTATQAGFQTTALEVEQIGWDGTQFVDMNEAPIRQLFKLYPWEWMWQEAFGKNIPLSKGVRWIEPAWKLLLSKIILPVLWEYFPDHPNLLRASFRRADMSGRFVSKPRFGREGEGVQLLGPGVTAELSDETAIFQQYVEMPHFSDRYAVIGSWVIGHEAAGIGIREDTDWVTRNTSCFVPHYFD